MKSAGSPRRSRRVLRGAGWVLILGLAACVQVDRESYVTGDEGETRFRNIVNHTLYLEGCSAFRFEKFESGRWSDRGPGFVCIWEGFAQPVPAGEARFFPFHAPDEPGHWRLRYLVGRGCADDQPLAQEHCEFVFPRATPPFRVRELCDPRECGPQLGMPNWLCPDGENFGGPTDRCLLHEEFGRCGWEIARCPGYERRNLKARLRAMD